MNPLVQVLFVMNNLPVRSEALADYRAGAARPGAVFEVRHGPVHRTGGRAAQCNWQFATTLFRQEHIQRLVSAWIAMLEQIVSVQDMRWQAMNVPLQGGGLAGSTPVSAPASKADKLGKFLKRSAGATAAAPPRAAMRESLLVPGQSFPLLVEPGDASIDLIEWVRNNRPLVERKLASMQASCSAALPWRVSRGSKHSPKQSSRGFMANTVTCRRRRGQEYLPLHAVPGKQNDLVP
jgi:hypothetical protein